MTGRPPLVWRTRCLFRTPLRLVRSYHKHKITYALRSEAWLTDLALAVLSPSTNKTGNNSSQSRLGRTTRKDCHLHLRRSKEKKRARTAEHCSAARHVAWSVLPLWLGSKTPVNLRKEKCRASTDEMCESFPPGSSRLESSPIKPQRIAHRQRRKLD